MLQSIPIYSDLGMGHIGNQTRNTWEAEIARRNQYWQYFSGDIFRTTVPVEHGSTDPAPELFPVGVNLVKMLSIAQSDSMFGEWEDQVVRFEVPQDEEPSAADHSAIKLAGQIMRNSNAATALWELELDRNIFGGGCLKIQPDTKKPGGVRWTRVPEQAFFPIWDPEDPDNLLEVYIVVPMTREQALARYGYRTSKETIMRVEHWTAGVYENTLDGLRMDAYSGINPWGVVPYVYIPRLRSSSFWGHALTEDVMRPQDELNMRLADLGEAINYNSHPVRWGMNLPRTFDTKNFPIGPNVLWNLGRVIGQSPKPEVGLLEVTNPVPEGSFTYINFFYDWSRTSSQAPPIAFGEDDGGGQRSGVTLEIRMWPLIKATRRSRSYMASGVQRALWISALILKQKSLPGIPARALDSIFQQRIIPKFANILPRDQAGIVDEVIKLMATDPQSISLETSQKILGRGPGEVTRIKNELKDEELHPPTTQAEEPQEGPEETSEVVNAEQK